MRPREAQQAELDREWQSSQLFANRDDLWLRTSWAEVGPAGAVVLWNLGEGGYYDGGPLVAAFRARGEGLGPAQVLDTGSTERHAVAGSANGGALAVWFDFGTPVRFAELAPGARTFSAPETLAEDARGYPSVAMNERGDAALLYRTEDGLWLPPPARGRRPRALRSSSRPRTTVGRRRSASRRTAPWWSAIRPAASLWCASGEAGLALQSSVPRSARRNR